MIKSDAVILGILFVVLYGVLRGAQSTRPFLVKFFRVVPALMLCYFVPALLNTFGLIDGKGSKLYSIASQYFLPASLVLLSISVDLKQVLKLGPKALLVFLAGSVGVVIGGPLSLLGFKTFFPSVLESLDPDQLWRGLSTVAGSWIGGGANQAAMKEIFQVSDDMFSSMIMVDILVADIWMAILLLSIGFHLLIDRYNRADTSAIDSLKSSMEHFQKSVTKNPSTLDYFKVCAVAFGISGLGHFCADFIAPFVKETFPAAVKLGVASAFFWLVSLATLVAIGASFTPLRKIEGLGASKIAHVFIMFLVATIGMHMDVLAIFKSPSLFLIGFVWILIHIGMTLLVARVLRAPFFFVAVGSQANIGGAASAPIIASAFHPALAPVGALLAIFGYAIGTYLAWLSALLMRAVLL